MVEVKVLATCKCGRWWYAVGDDQGKCEQQLREHGWGLRPEKCPTCRKRDGSSMPPLSEAA